jgi:hypothetical protein
VVHAVQDGDVQVACVSRYEQAEDMVPTVDQDLVAAGEALGDEEDALGAIAFSDQVDVGGNPLPLAHHPRQRRSICIRQAYAVFELGDQGMGVGQRGIRDVF